jgi:hypothetical protein
MSVALQGTPALFSSHEVLGFGSSIRERENNVYTVLVFIYLLLSLFILFVGNRTTN